MKNYEITVFTGNKWKHKKKKHINVKCAEINKYTLFSELDEQSKDEKSAPHHRITLSSCGHGLAPWIHYYRKSIHR